MADLSAFPITSRWPASHPDRLQLYSVPTPNGVKVSIMLEEIGLPYEPHFIPLGEEGSQTDAFRSLNPNGKIPAILDPDGPGGKLLSLFESGAILIYLAEKSGQFLSVDPADRYQTIQWLMFQMGGIGPMFGQVGFFNKFAGKDWEDKRPLERYLAEARRLLGVLDGRLDGHDWLMDDYSIADIATLGWVRNLITFYEARAGRFRRFHESRRLAGTRSRAARRTERADDPRTRLSLSAHFRGNDFRDPLRMAFQRRDYFRRADCPRLGIDRAERSVEAVVGEDDREGCVAFEAVEHRRVVRPPARIIGDMIDHDRLSALTDFVADRRLDLKLGAGIEAEADLVGDLAGHPAILGNAGDRGEAHPGDAADIREDGAQLGIVALRRDLLGKLIARRARHRLPRPPTPS